MRIAEPCLNNIDRTLYWLRVISTCNLADPRAVQPLLIEASELTPMLTAGMKKLHPL